MKKKEIYLIIGVIVGISLIGTSFALWNINIAQEGINKLETDCFKIEFTDKNAISLRNAYPIEDELGMMQTPYTFIMTNVCNGSAKYQINLETMTPSGTKMPDKYLKVNLSEGNISKKTTKLDKSINSSLDTEPTIDGAIEAYKLVSGIMNPGETKEFNLRIWMDSEVTQNDPGSTNTRFLGRISVTSSYFLDNRGTIKATSVDSSENPNGEFYDYKEQITKVVFEDKILPKETELSWDVSEEQNGSVMSYLVKNEGEETYTLYISSNGGIKANSNSSYLFANFKNLNTIEGLVNLDTSNTTNMNNLFMYCENLTNLDLSNFDTGNVISMVGMFNGCKKLQKLDLSNFNTSKLTKIAGMFNSCLNLEFLDLSSFSAAKLTMTHMLFYECKALKSIKGIENLDTSLVTNMNNMFYECNSLVNLDLSGFNTSNVTNMYRMFYNCSSLTSLNVSSFDTSNVTIMDRMFFNCSSLLNLDISSFDISKVANMDNTFFNCASLQTLKLGNFNKQSLQYFYEIFRSLSGNVLIYVKNDSIKEWILSLPVGTYRPASWTADNFIVES